MKLKELKELIEGCHPEDLNNNLEAVVVTANNNIFSTAVSYTHLTLPTKRIV